MRSKQLLSPMITDCTPGPGQLSGNMCFWSQGGPWEGVCVCVCVCVCLCVCFYLCTSITVNGKSPLSSHPVEGQIRHATFKIRGQQAAVLGTSKVSFIWC